MNGAFFTSALTGFGTNAASSISVYWNLSLLGVFVGLVTLVLTEKRLGEISLKPPVLFAGTCCVCLGTLLMIFGSEDPGSTIDVLGTIGAFATGLFTAPFYIAWSSVYGSIKDEDAEIVIPLAVALGQLLSVLFYGARGWLAISWLIAAPLLTCLCLFISFRRLGRSKTLLPLSSRDLGQTPYSEPAPDKKPSESPIRETDARPPIPSLLNWKCGVFLAIVWFGLSMMTSFTSLSSQETFAEVYLLPFVVGFLALFALLALYVNYSKRLSLIEATRIVLPCMTVSFVAVLVLPEDTISFAFLVGRTVVMFFWALVWIFCAKVIREGKATATRTAGIVRGWIQGGAALSVLAGVLLLDHGTETVVHLYLVLLVVAFAIALPAMSEVGESRPVVMDKKGDETFDPSMHFNERCDELARRYGLSPRESEIMKCLLRGRNLPYIRETLYISRNTINTHIRHIYGKMSIHSKQELIDLLESIE